jgi:catechol 2,3-dioxygenase-like lactoylglutathione lyase family enzyme
MDRTLKEILDINAPTGHHSLTHLDELKNSDSSNLMPCANNNWTLSDAIRDNPVRKAPPKISIREFNHVSREVLSLEKSKEFYCDILGFRVIPRPPFDCAGYWLYGHGLNLHLVATSTPKHRQDLKVRRIQHFSYALPRVDHIAFITEDLASAKTVLDHYDVYYKHEKFAQVGLEQIFLFDPDGNVIEVLSCTSDFGETTGAKVDWQDYEREGENVSDSAENERQYPARDRFNSLGHLSHSTDVEEDDEDVPTNTDCDDYSLGVSGVDESVFINKDMDRLSLEKYS